MSQIFLNYDDVRGLVSWLGKHRPRARDPLGCQAFISAALNTGNGLFVARLRFETPIEQIGIQMTLEHVTKLSRAMTAKDLTVLRHTDRLEIVANCFGWRADALMHHLKSTTGKLGRNPSLQYEINLVENFSRLAGAQRLDKWKSILRGGNGLYVVTGRPGNGVVHSYTASFLLAGAEGITDQEKGLIVGRSKHTGERVYGMAVRNADDIRVCGEIATRSPVIISLASRGVEDAIGQLRGTAGFNMSVVRGVLHQTLDHKNGEWTAEMDIVDAAGLTSTTTEPTGVHFPHNVHDPDLLSRLVEFATSRKASEIHIVTDGSTGTMRLRAEFEERENQDAPRYTTRRFADNVPDSVICDIRANLITLEDTSIQSANRRIDLSKIPNVARHDEIRAIVFQDNGFSKGRYLVIRFLYVVPERKEGDDVEPH
ncbi:hypothetical protein [Rhizobium sp. BK176]|uniref:hypothetical protein n=1 Tax=Rhizobium sp. BK176 TaxID=2587071 RepID=UPI0021694523|nr:hypothetical protein [Rhizobium sp. BK176]MCS4089944.1 hypothetical protein [Rhizobium sp. BK176]